MEKILVTPRSVTVGGHPSLAKLKDAGYEVVFPTPGKQPTESDLLRLLPGCVGYLAGVEPVSAKVLEAAKRLRVISRNGVGVDNVDLAAAKRLGIPVCKTLGANSRGVAELAMAHIFSLTRWVSFSDAKIKAGGWERRKGFELIGKTLGLVGCGNIGRLVAKFALGLDMKVLAYDVMPDNSFAPSPQFRYTTLDEVLTNSDVISLHCPAQPDGKPLIDPGVLARMKKGVLLINTARADLIDGAALAAALQSGQVAGAATDVFKTEPPTGDPLVLSDRVIATPHIGGFTEESVDRAVDMAVDNLLTELKNTKTGAW
ncbi:MAG: phosphoglycerate dehydrogenase [Verrucomicrobia bacterium]|nr:phosphoglycerate dehydrogenase [Verrucomicrobiota bacterium]